MRLRYNQDCTRNALDRMDKVIAKLGQITKVKGYRYFGRYNTTHEAVMLYGTNGTARLNGLLWGYGGEGPRGLVQLLQKLGLNQQTAENIAFQTPRREQLGNDWSITKINDGWQFQAYQSSPLGLIINLLHIKAA